MNEDAASLDRLHDLVAPAPVPWLPPAPGWYALGAIFLLLALVLVLRSWLRWRHNAWRREALRELGAADSATTIASLLRRAALAQYPREQITALRGEAWIDWLAERGPEPMAPPLRDQLTTGVYSPAAPAEVTALRAWAARWITSHRASAS